MNKEKTKELLGCLLDLKFASSGDIFSLLSEEADIRYNDDSRMKPAIAGLTSAYHQLQNHGCELQEISSAAQIALRRGPVVLIIILLDLKAFVKGVEKRIPDSEEDRIKLMDELISLKEDVEIEITPAEQIGKDSETSKEIREILNKLEQALQLTKSICKCLELPIESELGRA